MAETEKQRYEEYESFRKSRQKSEADFIESLQDQLDVSKKITDSYKNIVTKLEKANDLQDKARVMQHRINEEMQKNQVKISALDKIILKNQTELNGLKREMVSNDNRLLQIDTAKEILDQKRLVTEQELKNSMDKREGLQWAISEKVREETEQRARSLDMSTRITDNNEQQARIQERINRGFITREEGEQVISRLQQQNVAFAGELLISQDAMNQAVAEKVSLQGRLNSEMDVYEKTYERLNSIDSNLIELQREKNQLQERNNAIKSKEQNLNERNERADAKRNDLIEQRNNLQKSLTEWVTREAKAVDMIAKLSAQLVFVKMLQMGYERFVKLDTAAEKFREETGFTNTQMETLRKNAEDVNREFAGMGVSIDKVYKAAKALTDVFGRTTLVSKEVLANVSLLATNLGVSEENSAEVLSLFQGLGGATQEVAMNVIKAGAALSEKTGVPFAKVMGDVAKASGTTAMLLGANPSALMKAAIAARALGTDLNILANQQKNLLNYTSSINDELEASAMLGKSISFQEARRLAYEGKIEDSAKATLDMVKQAGDFNAMTLYQREALAKASGMDLKDLTKMLAVDKQREDIMLRGTPEQKAKLALQEKELKALKERNKLDEEDLIAQGEREIRQQKMQGLMTQFNNLMEEVKVLFADILEPIITPLVKILVPVLRVVSAILKMTIIPLFKMVAEPIKVIVEKMQPVVDTLTRWSDGISKVTEKINSAKDGVGFLGKVVLALGAGLLLKLFFGMAGPSALMGMITAPFKAVGAMAKGLISKVTGGGIAGDAAKGAADAAKGTAGAAKATERIPAGSGVKDFLTNLAAGLKKMGDGKVLFGALNLIPASIGLIAMIPGAIGMAAIGFTGKLFEVGAKGLAAGLSALAKPQVLLGTLALLGVGGAFALFGLGAKLVADAFVSISKVIPDAIVPLTMLAMLSPLLYVAAGGIGALTISLGALAVITPALAVGSLAIYLFSRSINKLGDGITNAATGMGLFAKNALSVINPLRQISSLSLGDAAQGMQAVASSLSSFGVGSAVAGIGSFIGNFLGGDPIAKMEKLASMSDKLKASAEAISSIAAATSQFSAVDSFAKSVGVLADSLDKLGDSLGKIKTEELAKLSTITSAATATAATTAPAPTMTTTALEQKLDKLTELLVGGAVRVYLNGKDVSANLAPEAR